MANEQILAKAIIEVGTTGIPDAEAHLRGLETDLRQVGTEYKAGQINIEEYANQTDKLTKKIGEMKGGIALAKDMMAQQTKATTNAAGSASAWGAVIDRSKEKQADFTAEMKKADTAFVASGISLDSLRAKAIDFNIKVRGEALKSAAALESASGTVKRSGMNVGYAALEASRGLEDLQHGLGGVVNNIPSLVMALGGTAGLTAGISLLAVGVNQLVKHWGDFKRIFEATTTIPKATNDVHGMTEELGKARDRMAELEKQTSVTLTQFAEYNDLRAKTADLEKKIADEQERQARVKGLLGLKDPEKTAAEKERADALSPQFGDPDNKALVKAVSGAMPRDAKDKIAAQYRAALERVSKNIETDPLDLAGVRGALEDQAERLGKQVRAEEQRILKEAQQLTADAVVGGKEGAFNKILELMNQKPQAFTDKQREAFEAAGPMGKLARKQMAARMGLDEDGNPLKPAPGGGGAGAGAGAGGAGAGGVADRPETKKITLPDGTVLTGEDLSKYLRGVMPRKDTPAAPPGPGVGKGPEGTGTAGERRRARIEAAKAKTRANLAARQAKGRAAAAKLPPIYTPQAKDKEGNSVDPYIIMGPNGIPMDTRHPTAPGPIKRRNSWDNPAVDLLAQDAFAHPVAPGPPRAAMGGLGAAIAAQKDTQKIVADTQGQVGQLAVAVQNIQANNGKIAANNRQNGQILRRVFTPPSPTNIDMGGPG